jgi:hypothetical protein
MLKNNIDIIDKKTLIDTKYKIKKYSNLRRLC